MLKPKRRKFEIAHVTYMSDGSSVVLDGHVDEPSSKFGTRGITCRLSTDQARALINRLESAISLAEQASS